MKKQTRGFSTNAVHAGEASHRFGDAVTVPVFQTSNFLMNDDKYSTDENLDNVYTRLGNPTISALVDKLNVLCNASYGVFFSSGMAAISSAIKPFVDRGDSIVSCRPVYGGTLSLFEELTHAGVAVRTFNANRIEEVPPLIDHSTRVIFAETLSNPTSRLVDIENLAVMARSYNTLLIVDNTFLSPFNFRALEYGAHIEIHSLSKYINGHSDVVSGYACTNGADLLEKMWKTMSTNGSNGNPLDAFLTMRGAKTLGLRMQAHNRNGEAVACLLSNHPGVSRVEHPSLVEDRPACYGGCDGFGGIVYLELPSKEQALRFMRNADLMTEATSLGGVETLVTMPSLTSHAGSSEYDLLAAGISSSGVRLSIGIEDCEDLLSSIMEALSVL